MSLTRRDLVVQGALATGALLTASRLFAQPLPAGSDVLFKGDRKGLLADD